MDQDVHLTWNDHQTTLLSVFSSLLNNENLVDCTISAEGQHFKAHRVILSAFSPYFENLFNEHCEANPIVILPGVEFQNLKALMEFMYSGEVKVQQDKLSIVLELAETLQIKGLSSAGDSEMKDHLSPKRRNESSILCNQQSFKKRRSGSQVKLRVVSSIHPSEEEFSKDIKPCMLAAQKCDENSSNSASPQKTVKEGALLQGICKTETFNMFSCSPVTKTINKSNTRVSGALLNSVSNLLDSSQLSGPSKVKADKHRMLSENVISSHFTSEKLRTSEPRGVYGEKVAADFLPQIKQENADDLNRDSIDEIVLDDETEESDNHDKDRESGGHNSNTDGLARVILEQSFSGQGFCIQEQFREPASLLPKQFKCNACKRSYQYESSLTRHLKYECGKEPQFKCLHCPARFSHKYDLKVHTRITHTLK